MNMANGLFALLPLLGLLALIKRVRDNWYPKSTETKLEERQRPSFQVPERKENIFRNEDNAKGFVWNELISLHRRNNWRYGIFESENYVDTQFSLSENLTVPYRYFLSDEELHFNVCVLNSYPQEHTTDLFVLAAHFNNLLNFGKVKIDVNDQTVYFSYQNELELYATSPGKIHEHIGRHFHISKDVYWAFERYLTEGEEPAVIIGELVNNLKSRQENNTQN
jgi:hypothetical protein